MSTILEALRKARRERDAARQTDESKTALALEAGVAPGGTPAEQQSAAEQEHARRLVRRVKAAFIISSFILLALIATLSVSLLRSQRKVPPRMSDRSAEQAGKSAPGDSLIPPPSTSPAKPTSMAPTTAAKGEKVVFPVVEEPAPIEDHVSPTEGHVSPSEDHAAPKPRIERADLPPTYLKIADREPQSPIRESVTVISPPPISAEIPSAEVEQPTQPETPAEQEVKPKEIPEGGLIEAKELGLNLEGIVWDKQKPLAMIDGRILGERDEIKGYTITKINKTSIEVKKDNRTFTLKY
jgi:hypothetical protein